MSRIKNNRIVRFVTANRKRKIAAVIVACSLMGGTAFAAYIAFATGSGQQSGTLGTTSSQAVTVTVAANLDGLTPGDSTPFTVNAKDGGSSGARVSSAPSVQVTTSDPVNCPASNFSVNPEALTYPITVPAAPSSNVKVGGGTLTFVSQGDQNGCSGKTVTIKATL